MDTLESHGFNKCRPPVCSEDIDITITNFTCVTGKIVHVEWIVTDVYNRNLGLNSVRWSCGSDSEKYRNIANPNNNTQPYKASFSVLDCEGSVDIKIKIRIGATFFYSEPENLSMVNCQEESENLVVHASFCDNCSSVSQTPPLYASNLYVKTDDIASYPVFFEYGGYCWEVGSDPDVIDISDDFQVVDSTEITFSDCDDCCSRLDCPSPWIPTNDGTGDEIGTFYFEYQSYWAKDHLYIIKRFYEDLDCPVDIEALKTDERVIFDTRCVGTSDNVDIDGNDIVEISRSTAYPQFFVPVGETQCIHNVDVPWSLTNTEVAYGFCVTIRKSDLPLGVVVECNCADSFNTAWVLCLIDPYGVTTSWFGESRLKSVCFCGQYGDCGKGAGTIDDPIILCNIQGVQDIATGKYYKLGQNINASETSDWNGGQGFAPVAFTDGGLDGDNYGIYNLHINRPDLNNVGLFASIEGITIENLTLYNATIIGDKNVGALIGYAGIIVSPVRKTNYITNCRIYGSSISGHRYVGGFIGFSRYGSISHCSVRETIVSIRDYGEIIGGFVGQSSGSLSCSSADCVVDGSNGNKLGGFVGLATVSGTIDQCFAKGSVLSGGSTFWQGGFVASMDYATGPGVISNCFSRSTMIVNSYNEAGFCGWMRSASSGGLGSITNCYYAGRLYQTIVIPLPPLTDEWRGGAFIGTSGEGVTGSFWDDDLVPVEIDRGDGGTPKTTTQMQSMSTFTNPGWDFDSVWGMAYSINNGYPYLLCPDDNPSTTDNPSAY